MAKKGSSGFKNGFLSLVTILILAGAILGWARVNNISSIQGVYDYFKAWSDKVQSCGIGDLQWDCRPGEDPNNPWTAPDDATKAPGGGSEGGENGGTGESNSTTNPGNTNPTGSSPTAGELTPDSSKLDYLAVLESIPEGNPQEVPYERKEWKHWSGSPCDTRREVLVRDGQNVKVDNSSNRCDITSGTWHSVYDEKDFTNARELDIDHVIPLSWAAKHGGQVWPIEKKELFANDKSQLLAVSASENRKKGDKGPSEYMPPSRDFHCSYSKIWVATLDKYDLIPTAKDKTVLKDGLQKC